MRGSPSFMGVIYLLMGAMFTYLAVQNVRVASWNFWTYFFIALATIDFMVAIRFFALRKYMNKQEE